MMFVDQTIVSIAIPFIDRGLSSRRSRVRPSSGADHAARAPGQASSGVMELGDMQ